ncbi:3-dehydroquinate synthase [Microbaculum marinisediminis]|uniref:3-dehydroquinate synthase n=1 Tax=Microbaculum marinisediminis TaxID=2931392 RepID=A0AAW5R3Y4_9HYPH|nr:3-dehydroquinate synthase [Microbaculum sp. A6E488]MCT8974122.1 3-dehydroquinate synthase [Microbaculum sp. A6E488]
MGRDGSGLIVTPDTHTYEQNFSVTFRYPVVFTSGLFDPANPVLADTLSRQEPGKRHRCIVFLDDGLFAACPAISDDIVAYAAHHGDRIDLVAKPFPVPGGERIKVDLHFVEQIQQTLFDHHIDRHSYVLAIGGGAVLDAVGLVSTTTHRGVRHIRVPTTVLSQNDSGVGVKNGVNLNGVKNFVGTFAPPFAVLNDLDFVEGLPDREKIAGMAEAVKVALIRDGAFFEWLERHCDDLVVFERAAMSHMIRRCAELHMIQIAKGGDPFETGSARPLDFGHWAAHRLETMTRYHLRHGEAVAIGIALDTRYSVLAGMLTPGTEVRVACLLEQLGFRLWHPALDKRNAEDGHVVIDGLREFQEHLGGELTITLLEDVGVGVEVHEMDHALIAGAIDWLRDRAAG